MADDRQGIEGAAIYRRFFENASQFLCILDDGGRLSKANAAWTRALGWAPPALAGRPLTELMHPDDAPAAAAAFDRARAGGSLDGLVSRMRGADGAYFWLRWSGAFLDGGRLCAAADDVSAERRVATHAAAIEQASGVGAWEVDLGTAGVFWSPALYAICGRDPAIGPPEPAEGLGYIEPCDQPAVQAALSALTERGQGFEIDAAIRTDAGEPRWTRISGHAERRDRKVVRIWGAVRDITGERAQRLLLERLSAVAAHTSNMVAIYDAEGRVEWVNAAFERRNGYMLDDIRGRRGADFLLHPDADRRVVAARAAAMRDGKGLKFEVMNQTRDGASYWVEVDVQPFAGAAGGAGGFIAVSTDITARKGNEARLKALEHEAQLARQRLLAAVEVLDDGFALYDARDRLVLCNQRYREIYPESAAAMVPGATFESILRYGLTRGQYLDAVGREQAWLDARLSAHRDALEPVEQALPGGRWLRVTERPTPDGGRVGLRVDITAIKRAERRLADIIAGTNAGAWEWNLLTGEKMINARWAEMLGYRLDEIVPVDQWFWSRRCHPDDLPPALAALDAHLRGDAEFYAAEVRLRHRDGGWIWVMDRGRIATRDAAGRPEWVSGTHQDITAQKAAEAELRASEARFRALFDVFPDGVVLLDPATLRIEQFNRVAPLMLGHDPERFGEVALSSLEDIGDATALRVRLDAALGGGRRDVETLLRHRDGALIPTALTVTPIVLGGRSLLLAVLRDITEIKRQQDAVETARRAAEAASEAKSQFLATMSHEIRTPMNGVMGMADLLSRVVSDPRQRQMVETIRESGEALMRVLNDILDFSKIEAGRLDLEAIAFVPADLARRVQSLHGYKAAEKTIALNVGTEGDAAAPRVGDPHRILQVLHNLVSNAVKFTVEGGVWVSIDCEAAGELTLTVRDSGIGMSPEQATRVFDAFAQADSSTTRRFGGTGLGMAIVRRLVDMMGGTIALQTAPDAGTTVTVTLPVACGPATAPCVARAV